MSSSQIRSNAVSVSVTRRVWQEVSKDPQATIRQLAERAGLGSTQTAYLALVRLRDAGYITYTPGAYRTRRILVPFVVLSNTSSNQESQSS